jgi:Secretion system C-terminal sorting domain
MKVLLTLIAGFYGSALFAQNLVPNPSFEINTSCPNQINQVNRADGWDGWGITPDYYHACANTSAPMFGIPSNNRGFQVPRTGQAYTGLFTFADFTPNFREFIGRDLSQPLVPGQQYFVSFWVCAAEQLLGTHNSNKIGIKFTTVAHSQINPDTALNNAHVFTNTVISDSVNWTLVSGSFIADSAYTHFGIGNYFDDLNTTLVLGHPTSNYAYYLLDDVCVSSDPQVCSFETAVHETVMEKIRLIPNPATQIIQLSGLQNTIASRVEITDLIGRKIMEKIMPEGDRTLDVSALPSGIYFLTVVQDYRSQVLTFSKQ